MQEGLKTARQLSFELAEELGVPPAIIDKAFKALRGRIAWTAEPNRGKGRSPRLYDTGSVTEIRRWVEAWREHHQSPPASAFHTRLEALEDATVRLERLLEEALQAARGIRASCRGLRGLAPIPVSITFLDTGLALAHPPLGVLVSPHQDGWSAALLDAPLQVEGSSPRKAVAALRRSIVSVYRRLSVEQPEDELWTALQHLIRREARPTRAD